MDIDMRGPGPAGLGISSSYYDPTTTTNNNSNNNNVSVNTPLPYGGGGHGGDMHTSALSVSTSSQPDDQAALSGLLHLRNHVPGSAEGYPHSNQNQGHGIQGQNPYQQSHNQHQHPPPHQQQNQNQHQPPSGSSYHYVVPDFPHSLTGNHTRQSHSHSQVLQLEQVISWANAAFFLRLYLKYQHALMPLVHKPTFAKDIVDRRDKTDEVFRGLLFSLSESTLSKHARDAPGDARRKRVRAKS
jgi:hypothetical protein